MFSHLDRVCFCIVPLSITSILFWNVSVASKHSELWEKLGPNRSSPFSYNLQLGKSFSSGIPSGNVIGVIVIKCFTFQSFAFMSSLFITMEITELYKRNGKDDRMNFGLCFLSSDTYSYSHTHECREKVPSLTLIPTYFLIKTEFFQNFFLPKRDSPVRFFSSQHE